jgi:hypothetical protein
MHSNHYIFEKPHPWYKSFIKTPEPGRHLIAAGTGQGYAINLIDTSTAHR